MKVKWLATCLVAAAVVASCDCQHSQRASAGGDPFGIRIPHHSLSEFRSLTPFKAKVVDKRIWSIPSPRTGKTHFVVTLTLEREGGDKLGVSDRAESEDPLRDLIGIVKSLEIGRTYTFPDALK